jgi:hypothetical protein
MTLDFQLTRLYRSILEDAILILDVVRINPSYKPNGKPWVECLAEGLAIVAEKESQEPVPQLKNPESNLKIEYENDKKASNKLLWDMLWDGFHSMILHFGVEELSQVLSPIVSTLCPNIYQFHTLRALIYSIL